MLWDDRENGRADFSHLMVAESVNSSEMAINKGFCVDDFLKFLGFRPIGTHQTHQAVR